MDDSQKEVYSKHVDVECWWCAYTFDNLPVGCPVKVVKLRQPLSHPILHTRKSWCTTPTPDSAGICKICNKTHPTGRNTMTIKRRKCRKNTRLDSILPAYMKRDHSWTEHAVANIPTGAPVWEPHMSYQQCASSSYTSRSRKRKSVTLARPIKYSRTIKQRYKLVDGFYFTGYFCSWACARAYGETFHPNTRNEIGSWIYKVRVDVCFHPQIVASHILYNFQPNQLITVCDFKKVRHHSSEHLQERRSR